GWGDGGGAGEVREGVSRVACKVGDTESRQSVEIRRYTLPKFQIDVKPDRAYYGPGEQARVRIEAGYFFGKPVAGARVAVAGRAGDQEEQKLKGVETDARGVAEVSFAVPVALVGRPDVEGDARLSIVTTITDSAGQKETKAVERLVTNRPVRVEVLPEAGTLVRDVANTVYLLVVR